MTTTLMSSSSSSSSRLKIWMTPVRDITNNIDSPKEPGDFVVWNDDSQDSLAPPDARLLTPLGGIENYKGMDGFYQQQQGIMSPRQHQRTFREKRNTGFGFGYSLGSPVIHHAVNNNNNNFHRSSPPLVANKRFNRDSSCNSSGRSIGSGCGINGGDELLADTAMNMKIGVWRPLPKKTCGFCYIQYKRHCQRLGIVYPRPTDPGFWAGHTTKDENDEVICPELRKLMCPLCFSTGTKAHTLKFCPYNTNNNNNGSSN